jgi:hypothetical protein
MAAPARPSGAGSGPAAERELAWRALVDRLTADLDQVADETTTRILEQLAGYRGLARPDVLGGVRRTFEAGQRGLLERRPPHPGEQLPIARRCGRTAAGRGIPVDELLHAYRIGLDVLREGVSREAPAGPHRDGVVLEALDIVIAWNSSGMVSAAAAHRQTELELMRDEEHRLATLVGRILLGTLGPADRRALHELYRIDLEQTYYVVCARPTNGVGANEIRRQLGLDGPGGRVSGALAPMEGDVCGFVTELPDDPLPVPVGVSPPTGFDGLADAFPLAVRALETASAARSDGVHEFASLGLAPTVLSEDDVGDVLTERYLAPLDRLGRAGTVVLDTVDCYLAHDRRLGPTARALAVHPNTVRYRIGRFEQLTGASLRRTEQLVEVWWALRRRRLVPDVFGSEHKDR